MNDHPYGLAGRTVLVTGASSGIGRGCALAAAALGANLIVSGRDQARLDETLRALAPGEHRAHAADLLVAAERQALFDALPPLDGVVHSVGINKLKPIQFVDEKFVRELGGQHFDLPYLVMAGLVKGRKLKPGASVVLLSSVGGLVGVAGNSVYAGAKAAMVAAARCWALELARAQVRVNTVAPGMVRTPLLAGIQQSVSAEVMQADEKLYPLGYCEVEDVAGAVAFLLSPAARKITGACLVVDGGFSL